MAVNMYREYRLKFYLNMRHYIIINEVKGETHPHTWEFALDIKFSRNLFVEFNIFEHGISQFLEQYQNKILNEAEPFDSMVQPARHRKILQKNFLRLYIRQVACSQELRLVKLLQEATL